MHSSFFILSRISSATISPLKQSMIGETYSLPSAHCTSVISVRNFSEGRWALKSRFRMFSCSCASVVAFVIPCGMRLLWSQPFSFITRYTVLRLTSTPSCSSASHAVVAIIRMLRKNCVDLDRKKLTAAVPAPVSKPPLITGLAQDYMRGLQARIEQAYGKPVPRITPHVYAIPSVPTFNRRGLT